MLHRALQICVAAIAMGAAAPATPGDLIGRQPFPDPRDPPSFSAVPVTSVAAYELGHAVFNTQFVPAGTPGAERRDGLGPIFIAAACDACHNEGAHGRGPNSDGPVPASLVIQLGSTRHPDAGDPVYGLVFGTSALPGVPAEGVARVYYTVQEGRYPDGTPWHLRVPLYQLTDLNYGPLEPGTVIKPRLAPAIFGVGLLEAVSDKELCGTASCLKTGRFGWQGTAISVRDQTAKAFAREMGLTSPDIANDDCTEAQRACREQPNGGLPEVSEQFLRAVLTFEHWLAVPERRVFAGDAVAVERTFRVAGCADCHRPSLEVVDTTSSPVPYSGTIDAYTDLQVHDLGLGLADRTVDGKPVPGKWRTAPLWGLGYRLSREREPTFLHDGRARSVEEAILWHRGEAESSRQSFEHLSVMARESLLRWIETF